MDLFKAISQAGWVAPECHPPTLGTPHRLSPDKPILGIDIGGTKTLLTLHTGAKLTEATIPTDPAGGMRIVQNIAATVTELTDAGPMAAAVAGVPAIVNPDGSLHEAPNLPGWEDRSIATALSTALGTSVQVYNDAHLAAIGEQQWSQTNDLVFIAVGTGIGAGIVSSGKLLAGRSGAAGEIFDVPIPSGDQIIILEDLASGPGLARAYASLSGNSLSTYEILQNRTADPQAQAAVDQFTGAIAYGIATVKSLLDPGEIILGGGLGSLPEVIKGVQAQLSSLPTRPARITRSRLGHRAAAIGALALAATSLEA